MDALCQCCQHLVHILLLGVEVLDEGAVEWQQDELMAPNNTGNQAHIRQFVVILFILCVHDVEQLLCEDLWVVDKVDGHEMLDPTLDLPLTQSSRCPLFLLLKLFLLKFGLPNYSLFSSKV
jgi:hypothetical protein